MKSVFNGDHILLSFPYDEALVGRVRSIPGSRYLNGEKQWRVPVEKYPTLRAIMPPWARVSELERHYPAPHPGPPEPDDSIPTHLGGHALMPHQRRYLGACMNASSYGVFADTGTGKTIIGLGLAHPHERTLVVCPVALCRAAWEVDAAKFRSDVPFINLYSAPGAKSPRTQKQRREVLKRVKRGIVAINFESFKVLLDELAKWRPHRLIVDESSKMKSPTSEITKALLEFRGVVDRAYPMSGTPAPNSELELYSQGKFLGLPWEHSFYAFRNRVGFQGGYMGHTWHVHGEGYDQILADLGRVSWHVSKADVLKDLPERTFRTWDVQLTLRERRAYTEMERHMVAEVGDEVVSVTAVLAKIAKLRQATSGFMYDSEDGSRWHWVEKPPSKARVLKEALAEIGNQQVLIWAHYRPEFQAIRDALGPGIGEYHGGVDMATREAALEGFRQGRIQYLVAQPQSIAHGVTLTGCSNVVWYSQSYSHEQRAQGNDRIYRYGQTRGCHYIDLVAPGTIDELLQQVLANKETSAAAVLRFLRGRSA